MTCLCNPAHYHGNPYGYHKRSYTAPCSSPGGNHHHKETSPTTGDQPIYHRKPMRVINQACLPGSEQSFLNHSSI